jgi:hypothetical protein
MVIWGRLLVACLRKDAVVEENPKYTREIKSDGRPFYYKNGRIIKKVLIPKEELLKLQPVDETVDESGEQPVNVKPERVQHTCLMCGADATRQRFANLQVVTLCEDDYFHRSLGEIVMKMRSNNEPVLPTQQA